MNIYFTIGICFCVIHILLGLFEGGKRKGALARLVFAVTGIILWPIYLAFYFLTFILACFSGKKSTKYVDPYKDWHDGFRDCIDELNKKVKR